MRKPKPPPLSLGGQLLDAFFAEKGWNQDEAARRLGVSQSLISRWLSGARVPTLSAATKLERVARVPMAAWGHAPRRSRRAA